MTLPFNLQLAQIGGMIRYEFFMQWRRKTMLILLFPLMLVSGLFVLTGGVQADSLRAALTAAGATPAEIRQAITSSMMGFTWIAFMLTLVCAAPLGAADSIPKDRQLGVRELLDSLPLSSLAYLLGKLIAMWAAVLVAIALYGVLTAIVCWLVVSSYDVLTYLAMWLLVGGSIGLVHPGIATLLAAGQSSRRAAVLVGLVMVIATGLMFASSLALDIKVWDYFNPTRPILTKYFFLNGLSPAPLVTIGDVGLSIGAAFLELFAVAVVAWWWLRRQRDM